MTPFLINDLRERVDLYVSKVMQWSSNIDAEGRVGDSEISLGRKK